MGDEKSELSSLIPARTHQDLDSDLLFHFLEGSPIPTFIIDREHRITHYNKALENLTGLSKQEVIGTKNQWKAFYNRPRPTLADLILEGATWEELRSYYGDRIRPSKVIEGAYEAENFFKDLTGTGKWLFFTAALIKKNDGTILGAIETLQDITEEKTMEQALRASERRYKALVDFLPYPLVLFNLDGTVDYINPAFTEVFGWTLDELQGKRIPYVPPGLEKETQEKIKQLLSEKSILRYETKRLTKDGRVLDVVMRGAILSEDPTTPSGQLVTLRDITQEKRLARNNEILLRISMSLPEHPDLEDLMDYVGKEIKELINCEGALVILLDFERNELYTLGAAYEDRATEKRVKEIRFKMDELVSGEVIRTGEPKIVHDTSENLELHKNRDKKLGYHTRNLLVVPIKSTDRAIGALCAINKINGSFDETDLNNLTLIANTVALSIENARFSDELKKAYIEVSKMNKVKDKIINHISHELKTPVSVIMGSIKILEGRLRDVPKNIWARTLQRAYANTERIVDLVDRVVDITRQGYDPIMGYLNEMLVACADEIETLISKHCNDDEGLEGIRRDIDEIYGLKESSLKEINLSQFVNRLSVELRERLQKRKIFLSVYRTCTGYFNN